MKLSIRKCLGGLILAGLSVAISANESNDPSGELFLLRSAGDVANCGPITALMARQYADQGFDVESLSAEVMKARKLLADYRQQSFDKDNQSWWSLKDIQIYLRFMGVSSQPGNLIRGRNYIELKKVIDQRKVAIINVNMNDLPRGTETGKPYNTFYVPFGWGHFIAVVGYQVKDGELYFETHDSFSPQGKSRLYSAKHLERAIKRYNPYYLEVAPS